MKRYGYHRTSTKELQLLLSCGRFSAVKIGEDAEAYPGNSNYIKSYRYMVNCASVAFDFAIVQSAME